MGRGSTGLEIVRTSRGGAAEKFDYEWLRKGSDSRYKECYLGAEQALNPRWYNNQKNSEAEDEIAKERRMLREQEEELMLQELGLKPKTFDPDKPMHQLDETEIKKLTQRGGDPEDDYMDPEDKVAQAGRIEGVGFSEAPKHEGDAVENHLERKTKLIDEMDKDVETRMEGEVPADDDDADPAMFLERKMVHKDGTVMDRKDAKRAKKQMLKAAKKQAKAERKKERRAKRAARKQAKLASMGEWEEAPTAGRNDSSDDDDDNDYDTAVKKESNGDDDDGRGRGRDGNNDVARSRVKQEVKRESDTTTTDERKYESADGSRRRSRDDRDRRDAHRYDDRRGRASYDDGDNRRRYGRDGVGDRRDGRRDDRNGQVSRSSGRDRWEDDRRSRDYDRYSRRADEGDRYGGREDRRRHEDRRRRSDDDDAPPARRRRHDSDDD